MAQGTFGVSIKATDDASKIIDQINRNLQKLRKPIEDTEKQVAKFSDKGIGELTKGFDSLIGGMDRTAMSAMKLMPVLGGLVGAGMLAGITDLINKTSQLGLNLETMSKNLGLPSSALQTWERAATMAGASANDIDAAFQKIQDIKTKWSAEPASVPPAIAQLFSAWGINQKTSIDEIFKQVMDHWKTLTNDQKFLLTNTMGFSPNLRNLMDDPKKFLEQVAQNGKLTDEQIKKLAEEQQEILKAEDRFTQIKDQIVAFTAPTVITWIETEIKEVNELIDTYNKLASVFKKEFSDMTPEQQKNAEMLGNAIRDSFQKALNPVQAIVDDIKFLMTLNVPDWMKHLLGIPTGAQGDTLGAVVDPMTGNVLPGPRAGSLPRRSSSSSTSISPFDMGAGNSGLLSPNERALADFISGEEGTNGDYTRREGPEGPGAHLDPNQPHPLDKAPGGTSSASGLYQFVLGTWQQMMTEMHMPVDSPMTRENQDKAFQQQLHDLGITPAMIADPSQREEILRRLAPVWDSMPGANHPKHDTQAASSILDQYLRRERDRAAGLSPPTPMTPQAMNGNIKIDISHATPPPPGFGMTVTGSGNAFTNVPIWQLP